jgi:predicted Zn-dependent peptidase
VTPVQSFSFKSDSPSLSNEVITSSINNSVQMINDIPWIDVPQPPVRVIRLPNDFVIYFLNRKEPNSKSPFASFRLLVKAGHFSENEEEKGLAHFLEHCVYLGTKNYSSKQICSSISDLGCKEGADANATTSLYSTIYKFDNIRADNTVKTQQCMQLLYEIIS